MEKLVESIRVSCPNAAYDCAASPVYYDNRNHLEECPHAPCYCPADACSFAGSPAAFLDHFTVFHEWPCTMAHCWQRTEVHLHDGFNTIDFRSNGQQYLFLLNVVRNP